MSFMNELNYTLLRGSRLCRRPELDRMDLGSPGCPKNIQNRCKKKLQKMQAQSKKSSGLDLNPLVPAQSKRTFPFSGKTRNS